MQNLLCRKSTVQFMSEWSRELFSTFKKNLKKIFSYTRLAVGDIMVKTQFVTIYFSCSCNNVPCLRFLFSKTVFLGPFSVTLIEVVCIKQHFWNTSIIAFFNINFMEFVTRTSNTSNLSKYCQSQKYEYTIENLHLSKKSFLADKIACILYSLVQWLCMN